MKNKVKYVLLIIALSIYGVSATSATNGFLSQKEMLTTTGGFSCQTCTISCPCPVTGCVNEGIMCVQQIGQSNTWMCQENFYDDGCNDHAVPKRLCGMIYSCNFGEGNCNNYSVDCTCSPGTLYRNSCK